MDYYKKERLDASLSLITDKATSGVAMIWVDGKLEGIQRGTQIGELATGTDVCLLCCGTGHDCRFRRKLTTSKVIE
jgi:hypothetical protein